MTPPVDAAGSLDAVLGRIREIGAEAGEAPEAESYSLWPADIAPSCQHAVARLRELIEGLASFAGAETAVGDGSGARTVVSWTGDLALVCSPTISAELLRRHFETLDIAVRRRSRMILIAAASAQAAASICAALASPAAAGLALRSVTRLICELQAISPQPKAA